MTHLKSIAALGVCMLVQALWIISLPCKARAGAQGPTVSGNPAPNPEQIHALILRAVENQHRDDRELEEYERTERIVTRKDENAEVVTDLTERVVPTGSEAVKLKTQENGVPVSPDQYRAELEFAVNTLGIAEHPNEHYTEEQAKFERRRRLHAELVDAATKAFRVTWAGRETRTDPSGNHGPRTLIKLILDPDPSFKPTTRFSNSFQHVHAMLWVDENEAQFARLEASIVTDIPFGGGLAGKVYRGGHVVMEQQEVAPDIWLPTLYDYEVDGRKFVFAFGVHERTVITRYRRVGPPSQALEILRDELSTMTAATPTR